MAAKKSASSKLPDAAGSDIFLFFSFSFFIPSVEDRLWLPGYRYSIL